MKQLLISTLLCVFFFLAHSQNGGQFYENNVIRVVYLGYANGVHSFKVINKQNCEARIRTKADQDPATDVQVLAKDSSTVIVFRPNAGGILFRVKAETSCVSNPDMGWLEINTANFALPLYEHIPIVIYPEGLKVSLTNGVLNTKFDNSTYYMHVSVYDLIGRYNYRNFIQARKHQSIDLNSHLRIGVNFIEVIIETRGRYKFSFRVIK